HHLDTTILSEVRNPMVLTNTLIHMSSTVVNPVHLIYSRLTQSRRMSETCRPVLMPLKNLIVLGNIRNELPPIRCKKLSIWCYAFITKNVVELFSKSHHQVSTLQSQHHAESSVEEDTFHQDVETNQIKEELTNRLRV